MVLEHSLVWEKDWKSNTERVNQSVIVSAGAFKREET